MTVDDAERLESVLQYKYARNKKAQISSYVFESMLAGRSQSS
jgi:hypothetical protein